MIGIRGLRKRFGRVMAVDGLSFEIHRGETFGLLGPNGAGKTTTIHVMVGLLAPDEGEIRVEEVGDPSIPRFRRPLGIAPQALSLYEDLTGRENLRFFGRLYGLKGGALAERVESELAAAGLTDRGGDLVKTYSGGMKRRLHLACALVHEPQMIILDEPTIGIDPQARHHILDRIGELKRQGRTILLTTHYMEVAQRVCDRVAIVDHGRLLALDTVSGIIGEHGGHDVVEAELETEPSSQMNLPGRLQGNRLFVETDEPFDTIRTLSDAGVPLRSLSVHRPDLESVFLKLTGRRLRD